uniref:hypothetical protein n=1 Tax=uncultured Acinetobacter sp. TaxID=165433 RepID=UPI00260F0758|nr:hypothetical protein [uncultured Acinetobacter sp.]
MKNIISYVAVAVVLFFILSKGISWWVHYQTIKENDEKVAFAVKNNDLNKCAIISNAISMANNLTDQEALDRYKRISLENYCTPINKIDRDRATMLSAQEESQTLQPYEKKSYSESDLSAQLSFIQLAAVAGATYPDFKVKNPDAKGIIQFLATDVGEQFQQNQNWFSIKVIPRDNQKDWRSLMVEIYYQNSYEESKKFTFDACKVIWSNIDDRVPPLIDELADRLVKYENENSAAQTIHTRYGYTIGLDASRWQDGYPVVCFVAQ